MLRVFDYHARSAVLNSQGCVCVAIVIRPAQGEEEISGRQRAGVHRPAGDEWRTL
jgi:hypothetical protein